MIFVLERVQILPADIRTVWSYFATPRHLNELTPPDMHFTIVRGGDEPMYAGQVIEYRVTVFPGIRVRWLTQITHVSEPIRFIDEQRIGPYRLWIHEHHFEVIEGGVRMTDRVTYALPYGWLGRLIHAWIVRPRLEQIFDYRREKLKEIFTGSRVHAPDLRRPPHRTSQTPRDGE